MLCFVTQGQGYQNKLDSIIVSSQIKKGVKAFNELAYTKAIRKLAPLEEEGKLNGQPKYLLAQAYLNICQPLHAEEIYASLDSSELKGEHLFYFAQTLKYNQKYEQADRFMSRYLLYNSLDSRAVKQSNGLGEISKILNKVRYHVQSVSFNSEQSDFGPFVIDGKIVFASARRHNSFIEREYHWNETPFLNIYCVDENADEQDEVKLFARNLQSIYHDGPVHMSPDGNELAFTRNQFTGLVAKKRTKGFNNLKLVVATKSDNGDWQNPVDFAFNGEKFSTSHGAFSKDGNVLYFSSDRKGGFGGADIWYVKRVGENWSQPVNMGKDINTEGDEMFPFAGPEEQLYFTSNGHLGLGGLDIFRAFPNEDGYRVVNMGYPVNTSKDDFSLYLDDSGLSGYFASNREGGKGDDDIYHFTALNVTNAMKIKVINGETGQSIPNINVAVTNEQSAIVTEQVSNDDGMFELSLEEQIDTVAFRVGNENFLPYNQDVLVVDGMEHVIVLEPVQVYGVYGDVYLLPEGLPGTGVDIRIEAETGEVDHLNTNDQGGFRTPLEPGINYTFIFSKPGYFSKRVPIRIEEPGYRNITEFLKIELQKAIVGASIEIEIFYEFNKWNINRKSAQELDDIVTFLKDNPSVKIELSSHTDSRGNADYNMSLSNKRAKSATQYIVECGIPYGRIVAKGYGETRLKNYCSDGVSCSEEEHQANRRTVVTVIE